MDTGKLSAWFIVLMILVSNVPISAAATNPASLTYSGTATGNYTLNLPLNADSFNISITSLGGEESAALDYWPEGITSTDDVWIKIPPLNGSETKEFELSYENGYSPSGADTFIQYHGSATSNFIDTKDVTPSTLIYEARVRATSSTHDIKWGLNEEIGFSQDSIFVDSYSGANRINGYTGNDGSLSGIYTAPSFTVNTWYDIKAIKIGSSISFYVDGTSIGGPTSNFPNENLGLFMYEYSGSGEQAYSYVREYASTEPTVTIQDQSTYYLVTVENNLATTLTDYQIHFPATDIGLTSTSDSLKITEYNSPGEFNLTASVIGDSEIHTFTSEVLENTYSLIPSTSTDEVDLISSDQNAEYEYEIVAHFDNNAPTISNMSPSGNLDELQVTFSANISDIDVDGGYDNLTIDFYVSGSLIDIVNTSSSGNVSSGPHTYENGGAFSWYIVATDEHGGSTTSATATFNIPAQFTIRDAVTLELVNNVDVEVMFYEQGELQQTVLKSTTSGGVDLTGLPVNSEFVVVVYAEGYTVRNTLIESLYEQSSIYVIPNTESNNTLILEITDYTGNFPAIDSKIFIQRSINVSAFDSEYDPGTYLWQTMSGDYIGADQAFQDSLLDNERYRFVVKNADGESRVIGQYNSLDSESLNLVVGELEWQFARDPGYYAEVRYVDTTDEGETPNGIIRFQYDDDANLTSSIAVTCYERDNETKVIYTDSTSGTLGEYAASIPLTGEEQINDHWVMDYTIVRDGESKTFTLPISPGGGYLDWPIAGEIGAVVLGILLLFFALMFGGAVASKGAVIVCALAAGLGFMGWEIAPMGIIIFVGIVAVLFLITDTSGDGIK